MLDGTCLLRHVLWVICLCEGPAIDGARNRAEKTIRRRCRDRGSGSDLGARHRRSMDMTTLGEILRRATRRIGPVFAGLLTTALLSVAVDAVMHACGIFPPVGQVMGGALFLLALAYRVAFAAAGGYVTARAAST